jgi:hypothetical protein
VAGTPEGRLAERQAGHGSTLLLVSMDISGAFFPIDHRRLG